MSASTTGSAEIITALWTPGCTLTMFEEHDSVPWNPLADEMVARRRRASIRLREQPERLAASYTLRAVKDWL